jgi:hypothetical protein
MGVSNNPTTWHAGVTCSYLHNEASRVEKCSGFTLGALSRRQTEHETQIESGGKPWRSLVWQYDLTNEYFRSTCAHRRLDLLQDVEACLVRVVMQDVVEKVCSGA